MKIFTAICGLMLIASCETGAKAQSNQSASRLNDGNAERISPVNDSERLDRLEALVEERVSYTPQIHGVVRARWEGEFGHDDEPFRHRFQVRNARVFIEGNVLPAVSYYVRVDACDRGKFKILDAWARWRFHDNWRIQAGQFRIPYGIDCFRGPGTYIFANRSFLHKYLLNMRNVGLRAGYYGAKIPLVVEAGLFNSTAMADHDKWQRAVNFAAKMNYRVGPVTLSTSFASVEPDSVRMNLWCGGATYSSGRWRFEAEYQNKHYTNKAHKVTQGWNIFGVYTLPLVNKGVFNRLDFMARYDGMTDCSNGTRNDDGLLITNDSRRQRLTVGAQIAYVKMPLKALIRLNYEHFFYPSGIAAAVGESNKVVAELVVRF